MHYNEEQLEAKLMGGRTDTDEGRSDLVVCMILAANRCGYGGEDIYDLMTTVRAVYAERMQMGIGNGGVGDVD